MPEPTVADDKPCACAYEIHRYADWLAARDDENEADHA
jgi:hypothetical protein